MSTASQLFGGGKLSVQSILASGAFIVPGGVYQLNGTGTAGGGGAGSGSRVAGTSGGSGGEAGEAVINYPIVVVPNETLNIDIGAGGPGGAINADAVDGNDGYDGTVGGDTVIRRGSDVLLRLRGGQPGLGGASNTQAGGETTGVLVQAPFLKGAKGGDASDTTGGADNNGQPGDSTPSFDSGTPGTADGNFGGGSTGGASLWGSSPDGSDGNSAAASSSGGDGDDNTGVGGSGSGSGNGTANKGGNGGSGRMDISWIQ